MNFKWLPQPQRQSLAPNPGTTIAPRVRWFSAHSLSPESVTPTILAPGVASR